MRYLLPLALTALLFASCQDDDNLVPPTGQVSFIVVTDQPDFPEGLAYDAATDRVYSGSSSNGTLYAGGRTDAQLQPFTVRGANISAALGMEVAGDTLFVAGGTSEQVYLVNIASRAVRVVSAPAVPAGDSSLINDVTIGSDGTAYLTNSFYPVVYRYTGGNTLEPWLELDSTIIDYQASFNLNGIAITSDDRYLLTVQTNTGKLYRIDITDKSVTEVNVGNTLLTTADGIDLVGNTLFIARNRALEIVELEMNDDYSVGLLTQASQGAFQFPTAVAATSDSVLVVNAQLDRQGPNATPNLPFIIVKFAR